MSTQPRVLVVCPTLGRPEHLPLMLGSLLSQTYTNWDLVLIGSWSGRGISALAGGVLDIIRREHAVKVLAHYNELCGINYAVANSFEADYFWKVDDDYYLPTNYLEDVLPYMRLPKVAAVGGAMLSPFKDPFATPRLCPTGLPTLCDAPDVDELNEFDLNSDTIDQDRWYQNVILRTRKVYWSGVLPGGVCLFNRRAFLEVGGFDEKLAHPLLLDDFDLCLSLRAKGYKLVFVPQAQLWHMRCTDRDSGPEDFRRVVDQERVNKTFEYLKNKHGVKV